MNNKIFKGSLYLDKFVSGFRRCHSGPRRHHGSVRLPVLDGHLRQRLHPQLHQNGFATENSSAGLSTNCRIEKLNSHNVLLGYWSLWNFMIFYVNIRGWLRVCCCSSKFFIQFQFYMLKPEEQLHLFYSVRDSLYQRGIIENL